MMPKPVTNESLEEAWASAFRESFPGDGCPARNLSGWSRSVASFLGEDSEGQRRR